MFILLLKKNVIIFQQVLDILLHRIIEQPSLSNLAEKILESLGILYKFHGEYGGGGNYGV